MTMKNYVTPEVECIALSQQDVIVTSSGDNDTPFPKTSEEMKISD